jgi:hypothetical protein
MNRFIDTFYPKLGTTSNYSAITDLHISQFTVTHALGSSVFTSRILETDLPQSHCHFKSHMKYILHSPIHFLPFLFSHLRLPSPELDPVLQFLTRNCSLGASLYTNSEQTRQKTPFYIVPYCLGVFNDPLPSHGLYVTIRCVGELWLL